MKSANECDSSSGNKLVFEKVSEEDDDDDLD